MKTLLKKPEPKTTTKTVYQHGNRPVKQRLTPTEELDHGPRTPDGDRPSPLINPRKRRFVSIEVGDMVTVKGDRDQKYLVTAMPPRSDKRGAEVELLEPGGKLVKKPLGWCRPFRPDLDPHNGADPTEQ